MKFIKDKIKISVDGFSSCGKSTLAKDIASTLGFVYIDSGAMYRAVTFYALQNNFFTNNNLNINEFLKKLNDVSVDFLIDNSGKIFTLLNKKNVEEEIRSLEVSSKVSIISSIPEVRRKMVDLQRKFSKNKSVVMDGRDIGTVVFPDADLKFFITADIDTRTQRRYQELKAKGIDPDFEQVKQNLIERDFLDQTRQDSPLKKADDAIVIDNSNLTKDEQLMLALDYIKKKLCK